MRGALGTAGTFFLMMTVNVFAVTNAFGLEELPPVPNAMFRGLDGSPMALSEFRGEVVLLNFWGIWCVPCLQEIPELVRLSHRFNSQGLAVVGVAVDSGHPDDIRTFMAKHGMDYIVLTGELSFVKRRFHVMGFPTSLLIDRQGSIHKRYFGPQAFEVLKHDVELLLPQAQ